MTTYPKKILFDYTKCYIYWFFSITESLSAMDTMVRLMPNVAIALLLLVERFRTDKQSFWAPYINMLPAVYSTVLYFSTQELQELKGSPALGRY